MPTADLSNTQLRLLRSAIRDAIMVDGDNPGQGGTLGAEKSGSVARGRRMDVLRALIVEDSPRIALRLAEMLSLPGKVEVAAQAATEAEAIAACADTHFDLAIVDLQLASGTGFGVISRLRRESGAKRTIVIVLTNHAIPALEAAALEAGADVFLDKSRDFQKIQTVVEELLAVKYPETS